MATRSFFKTKKIIHVREKKNKSSSSGTKTSFPKVVSLKSFSILKFQYIKSKKIEFAKKHTEQLQHSDFLEALPTVSEHRAASGRKKI